MIFIEYIISKGLYFWLVAIIITTIIITLPVVFSVKYSGTNEFTVLNALTLIQWVHQKDFIHIAMSVDVLKPIENNVYVKSPLSVLRIIQIFHWSLSHIKYNMNKV